MNCKISCSFGEIVDKHTILKIKKSKTDNPDKLKNICNEIKIIEKENPIILKSNSLFRDLMNVNKKLWSLEDLIRYKSNKKEYDKQYIHCAESIHINNDIRAKIKRIINMQFNSFLIEEKIYENEEKNKINVEKTLDIDNDIHLLTKAKKSYQCGEYQESMNILSSLMEKYKDYKELNSFYIDLIFSYDNVSRFYNVDNTNKLKKVIMNLHVLNISEEQKNYCKNMYAFHCLSTNNYELCYPYLNTINYIKGPNVNMNNMSFFKRDDVNKTLLIYDGGGLGDTMMFSRFIPLLCNKFMNNKIIFLNNKSINWIILQTFNDISNLQIIFDPSKIDHFDYHCSLITLMKYLNVNETNIEFIPLYQNVQLYPNNYTKDLVNQIKENNKKTYIFNWKGNAKNSNEKHNRSMKLEFACELFKMTNIEWIIVSKDITREEKEYLSSFNIKSHGEHMDNENSFMDTMFLCKNIDGVFSTDTGLIHLTCNLGVKTYVMLTMGCDWRWKGNTCIWYPNIERLNQKSQGDWSDVINQIKKILS